MIRGSWLTATMRRPHILILVLVVGLLVTACAGSDSTNTTTSVQTESSTGEASPDSTAPEPTTTTAAAPTTAAPAPTGGEECIVGSWTLDSDAFVDNFDQILAQAGAPDAEVTALDGTFTVDMGSDGTYSAVRDAWGFRMTMADQTFVIEINGEESGIWSTEGSTLMIDPQESDLTITPSMELDGEVVPLPEGAIPVTTPPGIASGSDFECSGDALSLTNSGVVSVLNRN